MDVQCEFCQEPVEVGAIGAYRKVIGWTQVRKQGGSNSISLASEPLAWAHGYCLDEIRTRGTVSLDQDPLF